MMSPSGSGLSPVAREILEYFRRHPKAQDTVEGISEWWFQQRRLRPSVAETKAALNELLVRGSVSVRRGRDGRVRYCSSVPKRRAVRDRVKAGAARQAAPAAPHTARARAGREH